MHYFPLLALQTKSLWADCRKCLEGCMPFLSVGTHLRVEWVNTWQFRVYFLKTPFSSKMPQSLTCLLAEKEGPRYSPLTALSALSVEWVSSAISLWLQVSSNHQKFSFWGHSEVYFHEFINSVLTYTMCLLEFKAKSFWYNFYNLTNYHKA